MASGLISRDFCNTASIKCKSLSNFTETGCCACTCVSFPVTVTKCRKNNLREEGLTVWLMFSEVSVQGQLAPLLFGLGQGRNIMVERHRGKSTHFMVARKQRETGRGW
jgi:hypothetical protein